MEDKIEKMVMKLLNAHLPYTYGRKGKENFEHSKQSSLITCNVVLKVAKGEKKILWELVKRRLMDK